MNGKGKEWFEKLPEAKVYHSLPAGGTHWGIPPFYCGCTDQVAGLAAHRLYIRLCIFKVFYLFNKRKAIYSSKWDFSVYQSVLTFVAEIHLTLLLYQD